MAGKKRRLLVERGSNTIQIMGEVMEPELRASDPKKSHPIPVLNMSTPRETGFSGFIRVYPSWEEHCSWSGEPS